VRERPQRRVDINMDSEFLVNIKLFAANWVLVLALPLDLNQSSERIVGVGVIIRGCVPFKVVALV
jgi:hypothetical protein